MPLMLVSVLTLQLSAEGSGCRKLMDGWLLCA